MGNIFPLALRNGRAVDEGAFRRELARVQRDYGTHVDHRGLYPSDRARLDSWNGLEVHYAEKMRTDAALRSRMDAFGGDGFHMARQLEYVYSKVLETKKSVLNGLSLFPVSTEVPVGARTHTVRRFNEFGEAILYRAGQDIPRIDAAQAEEEFPVNHIVTSFGLDIFEQQSSDFANTALMTRLMRGADRAIDEKLNRLIWYGHASANIYGVLTYPHLAKVVSTINYYAGGSAADDIIADLNKWANRAEEDSKQVFGPDTLAVSPRIYNFLFSNPRSATTDTTIGKFFLDNNGTITSIVKANELRGQGPASEDGMLFYRRESESISIEMVQPFAVLPTQRLVFDDMVYGYASYGGVVMRDSGNNLLVWAAGAA